jgi:hypothetical protein
MYLISGPRKDNTVTVSHILSNENLGELAVPISFFCTLYAWGTYIQSITGKSTEDLWIVDCALGLTLHAQLRIQLSLPLLIPQPCRTFPF